MTRLSYRTWMKLYISIFPVVSRSSCRDIRRKKSMAAITEQTQSQRKERTVITRHLLEAAKNGGGGQ